MSGSKRLTFALVTPNAPWWNIGIATKKALAHYGIEVELSSSQGEDHMLARVDNGEADLGVGAREMVLWGTQGIGSYAGSPKPHLRPIAAIDQPQWVGFAVTRETRLTSLAQIRERRFPLRVMAYRGKGISGTMAFIVDQVLQAYGVTFEDIESWGGKIWTALNGGKEAVPEKNFDAVFLQAYGGYGPVGRVWQQATILSNMCFLPVDEHVLEDLERKWDLHKGVLPSALMRGADEDVPAIFLRGHVIYASDRMDDDLAALVAQALDEHCDHFLERWIHLGYNPFTACRDTGAPLHPGAERYYRSKGYLR